MKSNLLISIFPYGSSIKYVRKIFRKTNISNPLIRTRTLEILVFRKILRTYLMDGPLWKEKQIKRKFKYSSTLWKPEKI